MTAVSIAIGQFAPVQGEVAANLAAIRRLRAGLAGVDLLLLPELALTGAPIDVLAAEPARLDAAHAALTALREDTGDGGPAVLVGLPLAMPGRSRPFNAAALVQGGRLAGWRAKVNLADLPPFDLFEQNHLAAGALSGPLALELPSQPPLLLGVLVGQDACHAEVAEALLESGAEVLLNPSALPFSPDAFDNHQQAAVERVAETGLTLLQANQAGAGGALTFFGMSLALDARRRMTALAPAFAESLAVTRWHRSPDGGLTSAGAASRSPPLEPLAALCRAMAAGISGCLRQRGATGVVVRLTREPASVLSALLAIDAAGKDRVRVLTDAGDQVSQALAAELGVRPGLLLPLSAASAAMLPLLAPLLDGAPAHPGLALAAMFARAVADDAGAIVLDATDLTARALGTPPDGDFSVVGRMDRGTVEDLLAWRSGSPALTGAKSGFPQGGRPASARPRTVPLPERPVIASFGLAARRPDPIPSGTPAPHSPADFP